MTFSRLASYPFTALFILFTALSALSSPSSTGTVNLTLSAINPEATPSSTSAHLREIDGGVTLLSYHARCRSTQRTPSPWSLVWNYTDSLNYHRATLYLHPDPYDSAVYHGSWSVEVAHVVNGAETLINKYSGKEGINIYGADNSMVLMVDCYSARLYGGNEKRVLIGEVPFDVDSPGLIGISVPQGMVPVTDRLFSISHPSPQYFNDYGDSADELKSYLHTRNTDAVEGIWEYLDRDTDDSVAVPDGSYRLGIVKGDLDGEYYILYLGGARSFAQRWHPMQLKGMLRTTPFESEYNLTWRDATGTERDAEQSATIDSVQGVLTLRFPLLKATLRFVKVVD